MTVTLCQLRAGPWVWGGILLKIRKSLWRFWSLLLLLCCFFSERDVSTVSTYHSIYINYDYRNMSYSIHPGKRTCPLKRDYFNRKYIWTKHQFSGDNVSFGECNFANILPFSASHQTWDFFDLVILRPGHPTATWSSFHESEADKHRLAVAARSFQVTRGLGAGWALGGWWVPNGQFGGVTGYRNIQHAWRLCISYWKRLNFQLAKY